MKKLFNLTEKQYENYKSAIEVQLLLLILGVVLQNILPNTSLQLLSFPTNLIFGFTYFNLLLISYLFFKRSTFIKWFYSVPVSIVSIFFVLMYVILLGFIPQVEEADGIIEALGLNQITNSLPFLFLMFFFLTALGFVTLKRTFPFKLNNVGFILNHFGLWLALLAGGLGASDLQRLKMIIPYDEIVFTGQDENNQEVALPFALELKKFTMDVYSAKIAIYDQVEGKLIDDGKSIHEVQKYGEYKILDFKIKVKEYLPESIAQKGVYLPSNTMEATASAEINISGNGVDEEGWVNVGNNFQSRKTLPLNERYALLLLKSEPKRYASEVTVYTDNNTQEQYTIDVNHPLSIKGWDIYQYGYNDRLGKWSNYTVLEVIKDPWLPLVYTGLMMMVMGSIYLIWKGKEQRIIKI